MKHQSTRDFFSYWDSLRADASAPTRNNVDPTAIRSLVADTFVLSAGSDGSFPFTFAGTRVRALFACNLIGASFLGLFSGADRADAEAILSGVVEEAKPVVAGISATAVTGAPVAIELLLLPFASRPHSPPTLTGSLQAFATVPGYAIEPRLGLLSWRFLTTRPPPAARMVRRLPMPDGLTVYEAAS
jgi:hypothetical protein